MVIRPSTAATPSPRTRRGRARPRIGWRPGRTGSGRPASARAAPKAAELAVNILPPELAAVRKLLPPDFDCRWTSSPRWSCRGSRWPTPP